MKLEPGMFVLMLNDMRSRYEQRTVVCCASSLDEFAALLLREKVEPYYDGQWGKSFRKGGPLEWFNPPSSDRGQWRRDNNVAQYNQPEPPDVPHVSEVT